MAAAAAGAVADVVDADQERPIHPGRAVFLDGRIHTVEDRCPRCDEPYAPGAWRCKDKQTDRGCGRDLSDHGSTAGRQGGER